MGCTQFLNFHVRIVIETLQAVEPSRKCFRMIGGVIVERTVAEVLPELEGNKERLPQAIQVHLSIIFFKNEIRD